MIALLHLVEDSNFSLHALSVKTKEGIVAPEANRLLHRVFQVAVIARHAELGILVDTEDQVLESEEVELSLAGLADDRFLLREVIHKADVQGQLRE